MAEQDVQEVSRPPEFRFEDTIYTYNTDMTLGCMDVLSDCIHEARQVLRKAMLDEVAAGSKNKKIDVSAIFNFQVSTTDMWHEISRAGKSARFVAACVARDESEIQKLQLLFKKLPRQVYQDVFDFFCAGGDMWNLTMPGYSNLAAGSENITASKK